MPLRSKAKNDLLKSVPLFEHCSRRDLGKIAAITEEVAVEDGKVLITEGDRGREFFVIISGEVEVRRRGRKVAALGPGTYFGEISVLDGKGRSASVLAGKDGLKTFAISPMNLSALIDKYPSLAKSLMAVLCARIRSLEASD